MIHEHLESNFSVRVVRDETSFRFGEDIRGQVRQKMGSCHINLVLIGPDWRSNELADPRDWVAFEITYARTLGLKTIPIYIDGADLLKRQEWPAEFDWIASLVAARIKPGSEFETSVDELARRGILDAGRVSDLLGRKWRSWVTLFVPVVLVVSLQLWFLGTLATSPWPKLLSSYVMQTVFVWAYLGDWLSS